MSVKAATGAKRTNATAKLTNLVISISLVVFVAFEFEMPAPVLLDASPQNFLLRLLHKRKTADLGEVRGFRY